MYEEEQLTDMLAATRSCCNMFQIEVHKKTNKQTKNFILLLPVMLLSSCEKWE